LGEAIRGFTFSMDGGGHKMMSTVLYPDNEQPEQVESERLEDIVVRIKSYLHGYIAFLIAHADKSVLGGTDGSRR
jgi:hypothetical protein